MNPGLLSPPPAALASPAALRVPEPACWALLLLFGASTAAALRHWVPPELALPDRALLALGISLLITASGWFFLLGVQCGVGWGIAMLIPYINLIAISLFTRRYWTRGARYPALLLLAATGAELLFVLRLLLVTHARPVL